MSYKYFIEHTRCLIFTLLTIISIYQDYNESSTEVKKLKTKGAHLDKLKN